MGRGIFYLSIMSQYISIQKNETEPTDHTSVVSVPKAKVALGSRAKMYLSKLGKSMQGLLVNDIFKELTHKEQKIIDSQIEEVAITAFEGMKKKM